MNEKQTVDEIIADEVLWSNGSIVLYHVTPAPNVNNIMRVGINPALSKGKLTVSWYVNKSGITWAIAHTSLRHDLSVASLVFLTTMLPMLAVKRTGIKHMFYVQSIYMPEYATPAEYFLNPTGDESHE